MKLIAALLFCLAALPAAGDDIVAGHVRNGDREIEIYNTSTECKLKKIDNAASAAIYPVGQRGLYSMGCVVRIPGDRFKLTVLNTGEEITFRRRDIITSAGRYSL